MTTTVDVQGAAIEFLTPPHEEPSVVRGAIPPRMTVPLHSHADPETFVVLSRHAEDWSTAPEHFLETSARYGYWNATPDESAAAGIPFTP